MNLQQNLSEKEIVNQKLLIVKQALDNAVKGSVFENMDTAFTTATAFNDIAQLLLTKIENEDKNGAGRANGLTGDGSQD